MSDAQTLLRGVLEEPGEVLVVQRGPPRLIRFRRFPKHRRVTQASNLARDPPLFRFEGLEVGSVRRCRPERAALRAPHDPLVVVVRDRKKPDDVGSVVVPRDSALRFCGVQVPRRRLTPTVGP